MPEPSHCYLFRKPTLQNRHFDFTKYFMFLKWVKTFWGAPKAFMWFLVMPSQAYPLHIHQTSNIHISIGIQCDWCQRCLYLNATSESWHKLSWKLFIMHHAYFILNPLTHIMEASFNHISIHSWQWPFHTCTREEIYVGFIAYMLKWIFMIFLWSIPITCDHVFLPICPFYKN